MIDYLLRVATIGTGLVTGVAYLRWAVRPVVLAYELGRQVGRVQQNRAVIARLREIERRREEYP